MERIPILSLEETLLLLRNPKSMKTFAYSTPPRHPLRASFCSKDLETHAQEAKGPYSPLGFAVFDHTSEHIPPDRSTSAHFDSYS